MIPRMLYGQRNEATRRIDVRYHIGSHVVRFVDAIVVHLDKECVGIFEVDYLHGVVVGFIGVLRPVWHDRRSGFDARASIAQTRYGKHPTVGSLFAFCLACKHFGDLTGQPYFTLYWSLLYTVTI